MHARQRHAAIVDSGSGDVRASKLRVAPEQVVGFLEGLGGGVLAVYEAARRGSGWRGWRVPVGSMCMWSRRGSIPKGVR
jgi:hypothetical protein